MRAEDGRPDLRGSDDARFRRCFRAVKQLGRRRAKTAASCYPRCYPEAQMLLMSSPKRLFLLVSPLGLEPRTT
jgi:hypothetical protein